MRLSVAAAIWVAGYPHVAKVIIVLSVVVLTASVESQIAKVILDTTNRLNSRRRA